jgi:hypothetical protein
MWPIFRTHVLYGLGLYRMLVLKSKMTLQRKEQIHRGGAEGAEKDKRKSVSSAKSAVPSVVFYSPRRSGGRGEGQEKICVICEICGSSVVFYSPRRSGGRGEGQEKICVICEICGSLCFFYSPLSRRGRGEGQEKKSAQSAKSAVPSVFAVKSSNF